MTRRRTKRPTVNVSSPPAVNVDGWGVNKAADSVNTPPAAPKPKGTYPRNPTAGWMRSELERLGFTARGRDLSDADLARMLREQGYEVSSDPAPTPARDDRDR